MTTQFVPKHMASFNDQGMDHYRGYHDLTFTHLCREQFNNERVVQYSPIGDHLRRAYVVKSTENGENVYRTYSPAVFASYFRRMEAPLQPSVLAEAGFPALTL